MESILMHKNSLRRRWMSTRIIMDVDNFVSTLRLPNVFYFRYLPLESLVFGSEQKILRTPQIISFILYWNAETWNQQIKDVLLNKFLFGQWFFDRSIFLVKVESDVFDKYDSVANSEELEYRSTKSPIDCRVLIKVSIAAKWTTFVAPFVAESYAIYTQQNGAYQFSNKWHNISQYTYYIFFTEFCCQFSHDVNMFRFTQSKDTIYGKFGIYVPCTNFAYWKCLVLACAA